MKFSVVVSSPRFARVIFLLGSSVFAVSAFAADAATGIKQPVSLDFDKVFNDKAEPGQIYFQASYALGADKHQVQVWRDRSQRLKRRTDDALETYIFKRPKETEWSMVVLDLKRKIRTDVDRTNLYRIGHFTDWFSMAHALTRPASQYQLSLAENPVPEEKPVDTCTWYSLTRNGTESKICWSKKYRLPLLIADANRQVQWRVTSVDVKVVPAAKFQIEDKDFVRNNANEDIHAD